MDKDQIIDKIKLGAMILLLLGIPTFLVVFSDGSRSFDEPYDHIRK